MLRKRRDCESKKGSPISERNWILTFTKSENESTGPDRTMPGRAGKSKSGKKPTDSRGAGQAPPPDGIGS